MGTNDLSDFIIQENIRQKRSYNKHHNPDTVQGRWTSEEHEKLFQLVGQIGIGRWTLIANQLKNRNAKQCQVHYYKYKIQNGLTDEQILESLGYDVNNNKLSQKALTRKNNMQIKKIDKKQKQSFTIQEQDSIQQSNIFDEIPDFYSMDVDISFSIFE